MAENGEVGAWTGCLESPGEGRVLSPFDRLWGEGAGEPVTAQNVETENVYIGAVKLQEQEIILTCGYTSMCELACMLCALLQDLGYVKPPPPPLS